jgi:hypothetical protein
MEQQFSQKWMATVTGTVNVPAFCLRPDAASFGTPGTTLWNTSNPGDTRQNSGDPSRFGGVAGGLVSNLLLTSTRARAFAAVASVTPLHSVR